MSANLKPYCAAAWLLSLMPLTAWSAAGKDVVSVPTVAQAHSDHEIPWRKGTVDSVFAAAKASNKPVFLYWGARWCPPCNQVKATIFNRQDFIEKSRFFLPVYIDGDSPGAQKLGARFKVRGYPTMILFKPNGEEITRLPGEVDAERYMQMLSIGINAARPVKELLGSALDNAPGLSMDDWRLLAFYSWDTDEQQLLPAKDLATTLKRLASACKPVAPDISARFALRALVVEATAKGAKNSPDNAAVGQVLAMLGNPRLARENFDLITNYAGDVMTYLASAKSDEQRQLGSAWNAALDRFLEDGSLSTTDRLMAMAGKVALARLENDPGALSDAILQKARNEVARADHTTTDRYARQSVISAAADVLTEAGLFDESDNLLKAELKRSHSPYYFMLGLAANAKKRGDKAAAVEWAAKAYAASAGPATRLQWGASYIKTLTEMAPDHEAPIEAATKRVLGELKTAPDTFYERNLRSLERVGKSLREWNRENAHAAVIRRLQAQLAGICKRLPAADPSRSACDSVVFQETS
ncbi:MAG: thioredoxin family protein [Proteobacteria bacterium]|nr:thioredoxin family protein [Pseudomonadota bacterium]